MRKVRGFMVQEYAIPESRDWKRVPKDTDRLPVVDTDGVSLGQFLLTDGDDVVYVVDRFETDDGFTVALVADRYKNLAFWSSNATFFALDEGQEG